MKILEPADIVVIAAGPSGLAAAIAAAEKGASVVVFEKNATGGGASNMGMGPLGVESKIQKKTLISITKDEAFKKFMTYTHWRSDARLVREYLYKSGDTIDWLNDMGVEWEGAFKYFSLNGAEATWHVVKSDTGRHGGGGAATMIKRMTERAGELGVEIIYNTPATEIVKENGRIVAIRAKSEDGEEYEIECAATVVCTGGFGANEEMVNEETGFVWGENLASFKVPGCVGDGLKMAWKVGAARTETTIEQAGGNKLTGFYNTLGNLAGQPNLVVNAFGDRCLNEINMANSNFSSNICNIQKGGAVYCIFDDSVVDYYVEEGYDVINMVGLSYAPEGFEEDVKTAIENDDPGFAAGTLAEISAKFGIDAENLEKTVAEYNAMCDTRDSLYYKETRYMKKLEGPRYYCVKRIAGGYGTLGGIKINYKAEALDDAFVPVPGLYAAGTDTCTIYADAYVFVLPGNTMGYALNSGRIAGESAVEYVTALYDSMEG